MAKADKRLKRERAQRRKAEQKALRAAERGPVVKVIPGGKKGLPSSPEALMASRRAPQTMPHPGAITAQQAFAVPRPPPDVVPKGKDNPVVLAMDEQAVELSTWAAGTWASGWFDGPLFMGYPALSLLAVLPEYRRMAEVLATECTRKWIKLGAADSKNKEKLDKVTALEAELKRLDVRGAMRRLIELDAFFGRAHLFVDVGTDPDNRDELVKSIGNGRNGASKAKFDGERNFLRGVKPIEPVWCYPSRYNATNPLKDDWYAPQTWFVQGQEIHVSRLLRFVGREVPDLLKPAYMFGGVSLSQLMKPYVDRWITVVQSIVDILVSFSTSGIKTNLETLLKPSGGDMGLPERAELFANTRTNRGLMLIDKDSEDFFQFNVPLSELEALLSKFQELLCSMSGEPVVKLLGIQPAGLNASSEGELESWFDWCEAFREKFCAPHLTTIIDFAQLSLFGEVDPDITWSFESLRALDPQEETERQKVQAETDAVYIESGVFDPMEIRQGLLADPESPYFGLEEITPELAEGPEGSGMVDPAMALEFPGLAPPTPAAPGEQPPIARLGGVKIDAPDATGQEDPRTARQVRRDPAQPTPARALRSEPMTRADRGNDPASPRANRQRPRTRGDEPEGGR